MPGLAEDDWLIYYDQRVRGLPDDWIGQLCVVWISEEEVYVKKVFRGRDGGPYLLVSTGGLPPIEVEEINWSAKSPGSSRARNHQFRGLRRSS